MKMAMLLITLISLLSCEKKPSEVSYPLGDLKIVEFVNSKSNVDSLYDIQNNDTIVVVPPANTMATKTYLKSQGGGLSPQDCRNKLMACYSYCHRIACGIGETLATCEGCFQGCDKLDCVMRIPGGTIFMIKAPKGDPKQANLEITVTAENKTTYRMVEN